MPVWFWGQWTAAEAAVSSANAAWFQLPIAFVVAAMTAWAAVAASRAARAAQKSVEVAQSTAKQQLRAYVQVEGAILLYETGGVSNSIPTTGARAYATVRLVNTGQTPAQDLTVRTTLALRPVPVDRTTLTMEERDANSRTTLGASIGSQSTAVAPGILSPTTVSNIVAGNEGIFLFGEVKYRDIFDQWHATTFSLCNAEGHGDGTMRFMDRGNEAD